MSLKEIFKAIENNNIIEFKNILKKNPLFLNEKHGKVFFFFLIFFLYIKDIYKNFNIINLIYYFFLYL
jgi:hypothetical protein